MKPKVSILTITYNHEKFIAQALEGFVMQKTNFPFIAIIGDDASTDNTPKIIQAYADKYPDIIKPILREKNLGVEKNACDIAQRCDSEYVALCEGDDYWTDPLKLQKQVDFLDSNKDYSTCFHNVLVKYEDNSQPDEVFPSPELRQHKTKFGLVDLLDKNFMQTNSVMYRWRFNENEKYGSLIPFGILPIDWFEHMLHAQKGKIGFIEETMSVYRRHPQGLWWESTKRADAHHIKHGIQELNFHIAVEKRIVSDPEKYHLTVVSVAKTFLNIYLKNRMFNKVEEILNLCPDCVENNDGTASIYYFEGKIKKYKKRNLFLTILSISLAVFLIFCLVKIFLV